MNTQHYQELQLIEERLSNISQAIDKNMVEVYDLPSVPFAEILLLPLGVRVEALPGLYAKTTYKSSKRISIECEGTPGIVIRSQRHPDAQETFTVNDGSMECLNTGITYTEGMSVTYGPNDRHGFLVGNYGVRFTSNINKVTKW